MLRRFMAIVELMRIHQWLKNVFVLVPLFFDMGLFKKQALLSGGCAFAVFCMTASAIYIFNDWRDIDADRAHAKKKKRPLPSGRVSVPLALSVMCLLLAGAAALTLAMPFPASFSIILCTYIFINGLYSFGLKHVPVLELMMVSSGFVLRLIAGGEAMHVPLSSWIIAATGMIAMLLSTGKRRGDVVLANDKLGKRKSLAGYSVVYLDSLLSLLTAAVLVVYLLFCVSDYAILRYGHLVLITAIPVMFGLLRYLQVVMVFNTGDAPTDLMMSDKGLISAVGLFVLMFSWLIYVR